MKKKCINGHIIKKKGEYRNTYNPFEIYDYAHPIYKHTLTRIVRKATNEKKGKIWDSFGIKTYEMGGMTGNISTLFFFL